MVDRWVSLVRLGVLAMAIALTGPAATLAQDDPAPESVTQAVEENDGGFDDWGLLGLFGLLGLAGLLRRNDRPARAIDPMANPIERPVADRRDDELERRSVDPF